MSSKGLNWGRGKGRGKRRGKGRGRNLQGGEEVEAQGDEEVAPQLGLPRALLRHLRPTHVLQLHLQEAFFLPSMTGRLQH